MNKLSFLKRNTGTVQILKTVFLLSMIAMSVIVTVKYVFIEGDDPIAEQTPPVSASAEPGETPEAAVNGIKYINAESAFVNFGDRKSDFTVVNHNANTVDFVVCIQLTDGTEIYRSEKISPGNKDENIRFTKTLSMGVHNAVITYYSCGEDGVQMSGVSFALKIVVE